MGEDASGRARLGAGMTVNNGRCWREAPCTGESPRCLDMRLKFHRLTDICVPARGRMKVRMDPGGS